MKVVYKLIDKLRGLSYLVTTDLLTFIKNNILSVTDLTRKNKLTEILNEFSDKVSTEVYIIQNNKMKNAQAVIADLEYFQHLLAYKEAVDNALDEYMHQITLERQHDEADIPIEQVLEEEEFQLEDILKRAAEIELE